ncbi:MAG: Fpg/Nei family DNA glycosylase [Egibacteraceae bacterium]
MPEGHTVHRIARLHREALAGRQVRVTSPQGRFAAGAAQLDGRRLDDVEAYGKQLFYRFGSDVLHIHLGLVGKFPTYHGEAPAPTATTRLAIAADGESGRTIAYLVGPMVCDLVDPDSEKQILAGLGPDPLGDGTEDQFVAMLARRSVPIGAALLDQRVIAGVGNVYRAEALFLCGIHPDHPARSLEPGEITCLWRTIAGAMRLGERLGRIVTVTPEEVGAARPEDLAASDDERLYVYRRAGDPCRRCATELCAWTVGGRTITACPRCQPASDSRTVPHAPPPRRY